MKLTEEEQNYARRFYREGKNLIEVAELMKCSIYDLSPWIYAEELREYMKKQAEMEIVK